MRFNEMARLLVGHFSHGGQTHGAAASLKKLKPEIALKRLNDSAGCGGFHIQSLASRIHTATFDRFDQQTPCAKILLSTHNTSSPSDYPNNLIICHWVLVKFAIRTPDNCDKGSLFANPILAFLQVRVDFIAFKTNSARLIIKRILI